MARRLLTRKRQQWVRNRTTTLKGKALRHSIKLEARYADDLERITKQMIAETEKVVMRLFKSDASRQFFGMDASVASAARVALNRLQKQFEKQFNEKGRFYTRKMVNGADKASKGALHRSLEKLSGGLSLKTDILTGELKEVLTATVAENVGLIKTVPQTYLSQVRGAVMRSITQPATDGLAGVQVRIQKVLTERAKQIRNKARNIALDQTRKTYNNLNRGRMEAVGLGKFEWVHSGGGQKPRKLHQNQLNGNIYSFDNLPIIDDRTGERGIPGQAINCRCTMLPVIEFEQGEIDNG